jgi:hypothetical protein
MDPKKRLDGDVQPRYKKATQVTFPTNPVLSERLKVLTPTVLASHHLAN